MKIFVDSDVIISSLLSLTGASYALLHADLATPIISSVSKNEIEAVVDKLAIDKEDFKELLRERLEVISFDNAVEEIKEKFQKYVLDIDDAHIVFGAREAEVRFLITYNLKDFKIERIKEDLNIIILTPGQFLQYLRSLK